MDPIRSSAAVLVRLDLDQRRLGTPHEAGDGPGVGIGLLELVGGAMHDELEQFLPGAVPREVQG